MILNTHWSSLISSLNTPPNYLQTRSIEHAQDEMPDKHTSKGGVGRSGRKGSKGKMITKSRAKLVEKREMREIKREEEKGREKSRQFEVAGGWG